MNADDDGDGERFVTPLHFIVQRPEVAADGHEDPKLPFPRHHQAIVARVSNSRIRIGSNDDARRDIGRGIDIIVSEQRNFCEIHIVAGFNHFVHLPFADFDRRNRFTLPLGKFRRQLFGFTLECQRHQLAAGLHIDHDWRLATFDILAEQQRKTFLFFQLREQRCNLVARRYRFRHARDFFGRIDLQFADEVTKVRGHEFKAPESI